MAERTTHEIVVDALQQQLHWFEALPAGMRGNEGKGTEIREVLSDLHAGRCRIVVPVIDDAQGGAGYVAGPKQQGELKTARHGDARAAGELLALAGQARQDLKDVIDAGHHVFCVHTPRRSQAIDGVVESGAALIFDGDQVELVALIAQASDVVGEVAKRAGIDLSALARLASAPEEMLGDRPQRRSRTPEPCPECAGVGSHVVGCSRMDREH
jgi:hypothetical protein